VAFGGVLSGAGGFTKKGADKLTLAGPNTYTGPTVVSEGTLVVTGTLGGGSYAGDISNAGSLIFDQPADQTLSGVLSGQGSLTKTGAGALILSGTNTYTGPTTVESGILDLRTSLASKDVTVHGGATFRTTNFTQSLDNGTLTVRGENATYDGDLQANDATLNFIAPLSVTTPLLKVSGSANISDSAINVGVFAPGGTRLPLGTQLPLIAAAKGLEADNLTQGQGFVEAGVTTIYGLTLTPNPTTGELEGTVISGAADERAKTLSEGFVSGVGLVATAGDLVAGKGMESAVNAASRAGAAGTGYGVAAFGAVSGGSVRYNTGSHVNMNSLSLLVGLSRGVDLQPGRLTLGAFFEYGNGSYDTHNSFGNAGSLDGDGDVYHTGGGILGRMDFVNAGPGHVYAELSGRAGGVHNEYDNSDLRDVHGTRAEYESSSAYYGVHVGLGYIWNVTEAASLDVYGKYLWTRQEGDSVRLSTDDRVKFEDADSSRLRLGGRLAYAVNEVVSPYIGAAWEHEFDGRARAATADGFAIDAPSLRGDTGIGELGLSLKPSAQLPLFFDLGVQGYAGKREGVTGSLQARIEF
jgi:autotransporter-associated beta strand protein